MRKIFVVLFVALASITARAEYPFPNGTALKCKARSQHEVTNLFGNIANIMTGIDKKGNLTVIALSDQIEADGRLDIGLFWAQGSSDADGLNANFKLLRQDFDTSEFIEIAELSVKNGAGTLAGKYPTSRGDFVDIDIALSECSVR